MNNVQVNDLGIVLNGHVLNHVIDAAQAHIDGGEVSKAWTVLGPAVEQMELLAKCLDEESLLMTPDDTNLIREVAKRMRDLYDKLELAMTAPYEKGRCERMRRLGL
jgi:hypothetical protein